MIVTNKTRPLLLLSALGVAAAGALVFAVADRETAAPPPGAARPAEVSAALIVLGYLRGVASREWTTELLSALLYYAADHADSSLTAAVSAELPKQVAQRAPAIDAGPIIAAARARSERDYQAALLTAP